MRVWQPVSWGINRSEGRGCGERSSGAPPRRGAEAGPGRILRHLRVIVWRGPDGVCSPGGRGGGLPVPRRWVTRECWGHAVNWGTGGFGGCFVCLFRLLKARAGAATGREVLSRGGCGASPGPAAPPVRSPARGGATSPAPAEGQGRPVFPRRELQAPGACSGL